jgi:fructosamine-3-kinase
MNLTPDDYYRAACLDAAHEKLSVDAISQAYVVSKDAKEFFVAIQAAIKLKEICDDLTNRH